MSISFRPYTGIGSRKTPPEVLEQMRELGRDLATVGYTLQSGAAVGADSAFEAGCDSVSGSKQIYLPSGFIPEPAFELAAGIHPYWPGCNDYSRRRHARNCLQVLGQNLDSPSEFVICWTERGKDVGGTRTAILLARQHEIPVFNLWIGDVYERLREMIERERAL